MGKTFEEVEKVRFKHVDFAGIVFYPRFLEMVNDLIENYFEKVLKRPFGQIHETNGIPTVDLKVQFKNPARIGDLLTKILTVKSLGAASMTCQFVFKHSDQSICLEGEVTLVNVVLNKEDQKLKAEPFNDDIRNKIIPYLVDMA